MANNKVATQTQLNLGTIGIILTLLVNMGVVISYASSIQAKLDSTKSVSIQNCNLLKSAIILSIEQSRTPKTDPQVMSAIRQNFERITCNK